MRYVVTVLRTAYKTVDIAVEAEDDVEAEALALEQAPNYEFRNEQSSEYEVAGSRRIA